MSMSYPREPGVLSEDDVRREAERLSAIDILRELLALSVVEASYSPGTRITLSVSERQVRIRDTGRGMQLRPDRGDTISHATRALTGHYPCLPEDATLENALNRIAWSGRGSLGPAVINFACPKLRFTSFRDGMAWTQSFSWGNPDGPPEQLGPTADTGTEIELELPDAVGPELLPGLVESFRGLVESLEISVSDAGATP